MTPDVFPVVMDSELRAMWREHGDVDVRRLILEVHRARTIMRAAHTDALAVQLAMWHHRDGDMKASLQKLIDSMLAEKIRLGAMGGKSVER